MQDNILLQLAVLFFLSNIAKIIIKIKQSTVLSQLLIGIVIAIFAHFKYNFFATMIHSETIKFLAEFAIIILLFEIGLESDFKELKQSSKNAIIVAITGVAVPFITGYFIVAPILLKYNILSPLLQTNQITQTHHIVIFKLFIASILSVTSTGISISVFKEFKMLQSNACKIILSASIIDDICGLILLSTIASFAISQTVNVTNLLYLIIMIILFFMMIGVIGKYILHPALRYFSKISNSEDALIKLILAYALLLAFIAHSIGLATIIGAFLAGLFINQQTLISEYKYLQSKHIIASINPFTELFTPIFFIYAGMQVDIIASFSWHNLYLAIILSIAAILSKIVAAIFLPKNLERLIIGIGMIPRGEIGLIFAITGLELKIINNELFMSILLMIVISSIITPTLLNKYIKK